MVGANDKQSKEARLGRDLVEGGRSGRDGRGMEGGRGSGSREQWKTSQQYSRCVHFLGFMHKQLTAKIETETLMTKVFSGPLPGTSAPRTQKGTE